MKCRWIYLAVAFLFVSTATAANDEPTTLAEVLRSARAYSPLVHAAAAQVREREADITRAQGAFDHLDVVEVVGIPQIDDQVAAGVAKAVLFDEEVFAIFPIDGGWLDGLYLCSGVWCLRFGIHRDLGTSKSHPRPPSNQR